MTGLIGNQYIEYVEESAEGTTPSNPTMLWLGLVAPVKISLPQQFTSKKYLAADGSTNKLGAVVHTRHTEKIEFTFTVELQSLTFWAKYCLGAAAGTNDNPTAISLGIGLDTDQDGSADTFILGKGMKCKSATLSCEKDGPLTLQATFWGIDSAGFGSDYIGSGAHASATTTSPTQWSDYTALTWQGNDMDTYGCYINGFEIAVDYDLKQVPDVGSSKSTGFVTQVHASRSLTVGLDAKFSDQTSVAEVRSGSSGSFVLTGGGDTVTIAGCIFPQVELPLDPEDLISHKFTSLDCTSVVIS